MHTAIVGVLLATVTVATSAVAGSPAYASDDPTPGQAQSSSSTFHAVGTVLGYDSAASDGPLKRGAARTITVAGLPADAHSALIVLTAHHAKARGDLSIRRTPTGGAIARFAFPARAAKSTIILVPVSQGHLFLKASKKAAVDVTVSLLGYDVGPVAPRAKGRTAVDLARGKWAVGSQQTIAVAHQYGTPRAKKLVAALVRITTRHAVAAGGVQIYPAGSAPSGPVAPITAGHPTSTIALVPTGQTGQLNISVTEAARVRVELIGYVANGPSAAQESDPQPTAPAPTTTAAPAPANGAANPAAVAVQYALSKVGDKYVAGAAGPDTFDCSGLTMAAWAAAGVKLTHLSYTQYDQTQRTNLADLQPGDLLFYFGDGLHHVTIYVGNGQMANAANPASGVIISAVNEPWYAQHLTGVGRVAAPAAAATHPQQSKTG